MVWAPPERQYPALNASGTVASSHRHSTASHEPAVHVVEVGAAHKTVDVKAHEPTKVVGCASGDWFCIMVLVFVLASAGIVCISIYVYVPRSSGGVAIAGALLLIIAAVVAALWVVYVRRRHNRLHAAEEEATAAANAGVIRYVVDNPKTTCAICQGPLSAPCDKDHSILLGRGRRRSADRAGRSKRHSASVVEGKVPADALDEPASGSRRSARRSHTSHHMGKRHSSSRKHSHRKSDAAAKPRKRKSSSSSRGSVADVMDICPIATGACGHMFHFHCIAQHAVEMRRTHLKVTCPLDPWVWTLCTQDKGKEEEMEKEYLAMFAHMRKEAASDARAKNRSSRHSLTNSMGSAYAGKLKASASHGGMREKRHSRRSNASHRSHRHSNANTASIGGSASSVNASNPSIARLALDGDAAGSRSSMASHTSFGSRASRYSAASSGSHRGKRHSSRRSRVSDAASILARSLPGMSPERALPAPLSGSSSGSDVDAEDLENGLGRGFESQASMPTYGSQHDVVRARASERRKKKRRDELPKRSITMV